MDELKSWELEMSSGVSFFTFFFYIHNSLESSWWYAYAANFNSLVTLPFFHVPLLPPPPPPPPPPGPLMDCLPQWW
jgi:hypothetical protein